MNIFIIISIAVVVAVAAILWKKKHKKSSPLELDFADVKVDVTVIDGTLDFSKYVVDFLKAKGLEKGKDIPFIASKDCYKDGKEIPGGLSTKPNILYVGVYNEDNNEIVCLRRIDSDEWDRQTRDVLGKEKFVVLS